MSLANFDEIRKICCDYEEDQPTRVRPFKHLELFPEGRLWEERMQHDFYPSFANRENKLPSDLLHPEPEDAVYMIRYGQLV